MQAVRWCFTLNNYDESINYVEYFGRVEFGIRRGIWGREVGEQGTRHLQGYVEFKRSVRLGKCRKVLDRGHWEKARGTPKENYEYCIKDGSYETLGEWRNVLEGKRKNDNEKEDEFRNLLRCVYEDPEDDIRNSTRYVYRKRCIDERVMELRQQFDARARYDRISKALVSSWQLQILEKLFNQGPRNVLWVADTRGGTGKTFLGHVLNACYGYDLFDGITACKDIAWMLSGKIRGIAFDVTRSDSGHFSYQSLESCKNGFVMSGKYQGIRRIFEPVPVIVFANFEPDRSRLSEDRWEVVDCDEIEEEDKIPKEKAWERFPYVAAPKSPFEEREEEGEPVCGEV